MSALWVLWIVTAAGLAIQPASADEGTKDSTEILPAIAATYAPAHTPDLAEAAKQVVTLTNELRESKKLPKLTLNPKLRKTTELFAGYMARTSRYGHEADGKTAAERIEKQEYDYCVVGENIAYAYRSSGFTTEDLVKGLFEGWKASPGHLENMLDPDVTETGLAIEMGPSGYFLAVHLFGRPKSAVIEFKLTNESDAEFEYSLGRESLSLKPRATRIHQACRAQDLEFAWRDGEEDRSVQPKNGDQFTVARQDGRFRLSRKE